MIFSQNLFRRPVPTS
ncbi:hypothetical protein B7996_04570 [Staphylococcus aureus]|nr:hypothetical protein B7996_04570 [Staphylococcus aureus]